MEVAMKQGERFGKLILSKKVSKGQKNPQISAKWLCICDCGREKIVTQNCLQTGSTRSCGCLVKRVLDKDYEERIKVKILENIKIDGKGCWLWQGTKHRQGYGLISYNRKPSLLHRVSWIVYIGELPKGMKICHSCDVPSCCNPSHLFLGTQKDNINDANKKGRLKPGILPIRNKLNWDQVQEIKRLHSIGINRKELRQKFHVSQTCIAKILRGDSWKINRSKEL